jgi:hypothetical protein
MRFQSSTSFNAYDSSMPGKTNGTKSKERITIYNGVERRCEVVLTTMLRLGATTSAGVLEHLQRHYSVTYTRNDVRHCIKRLVNENLVRAKRKKNEPTVYSVSNGVIVQWRKMTGSKSQKATVTKLTKKKAA